MHSKEVESPVKPFAHAYKALRIIGIYHAECLPLNAARSSAVWPIDEWPRLRVSPRCPVKIHPRDAPTAGGSRRRGSSRMRIGQIAARVQAAHFIQQTGGHHLARSAVRAPHAGVPGPVGTSATMVKFRASAVAVCACSVGDRSARWWHAPPARAGCAGRRSDGCAPRRPRSSAMQARMHAGQPCCAACASRSARISASAGRQRRDAAEQRAQVQHGAADQQRNLPARFDVVDGARRIAHELSRRVARRSARACRPGDAEPAHAVAADGLALPMSRPRYTCAESTLTISIGILARQRQRDVASCRCRSAR